MLLATLWLSNIIQLAVRYSWGIAIPFASKQLEINSFLAGLVGSSFYIGYVITGIPSGYISDRVGPRIATTSSLLFLALLTALIGLSRSYAAVLAAYFISGIIAGPIFPSSLKVISEAFGGGRRATSVGMLETVSPIAFLISASIFPIITNKLGWNYMYFVIALASVAAAALYLVYIPSRSVQVNKEKVEFANAIKNRQVINGAAIRLGGMWGLIGLSTWYYFLAINSAKNLLDAQLLLVILSLFAVIGQVLGGIFSDRWLSMGRKRLATEGLYLFTLSLLLLAFGRAGWVVYFSAAITGFSAYFWKAGLDTYIVEAASATGTASGIGVMNTISQLGSLAAPAAVGFALDLFGTSSFYPVLFLLAGPLASSFILTAGPYSKVNLNKKRQV
ncbi:MAG: MFS transporter [Nitrososphaerota archaeon]